MSDNRNGGFEGLTVGNWRHFIQLVYLLYYYIGFECESLDVWIKLRKYCLIIIGFLMSAGENWAVSDVVQHGQEFFRYF